MNDPSFIRAHRLKRERHSGLSHTVRGVIRHRLKLSLASRAKPIHITNQTLATSEASAKDLIEQVLQRFKQLASLRLEQLGIPALDIEHFPSNALFDANAQFEPRHFKDVFEKLRCLL
jgi:hypothetical protein